MNDDQVRLFIIQANPPGSLALGTDVEERKLQEALRRGQGRDHFAHPTRLPAARISDLLTELRAQQPHILHFMGHGELRHRAKQPAPANANLAALRDWLLDAYTPIYIEMRSLVRDAFPGLPADAQQPAARPTAETLWRYLHDTLPAGDLERRRAAMTVDNTRGAMSIRLVMPISMKPIRVLARITWARPALLVCIRKVHHPMICWT